MTTPTPELREACYDKIISEIIARGVLGHFDEIEEASQLLSKLTALTHVLRVQIILNRGHGARAQEIFDSGSKVADFILGSSIGTDGER